MLICQCIVLCIFSHWRYLTRIEHNLRSVINLFLAEIHIVQWWHNQHDFWHDDYLSACGFTPNPRDRSLIEIHTKVIIGFRYPERGRPVLLRTQMKPSRPFSFIFSHGEKRSFEAGTQETARIALKPTSSPRWNTSTRAQSFVPGWDMFAHGMICTTS